MCQRAFLCLRAWHSLVVLVNTPTHAIVALALLSRRDRTVRNRWVLAGALLPDLAIFLWAPWQRWGMRRDWTAIWRDHYFETVMKTLIAVFNSVPIYSGLLLIGYWQRRRGWSGCLLVFAVAALLHILLDAPVHGHDAYRHFWPLSDWRFYSPISYWEADLHARWVSLIEAGLMGVGTIVLWRRLDALWVRIGLSFLLALTLLATVTQQLAAFQTPV